MTVLHRKQFFLFVMTAAGLSFVSYNVGLVGHIFAHPELHPHPTDSNHLIVGSTTAILFSALIICLFLRNKKMENDLKDALFNISTMHKNNSYFTSLMDNSLDMVHLNDLEGNIVYANKATETILGYKPVDLINKPAADLIHPDEREQIAKDMGSLGEDELHPPKRQLRLLKSDGEYISVNVKGFVFELNGQKLLGAVLKDMEPERKALDISEGMKKWEEAFNSITSLLSIHDKSYKVVNVNQSLIDYLGVQKEDLIGKYCYEIFHQTELPWPDCPNKKMFETNETSKSTVFSPNMAEPLDIECHPIHDSTGQIVGTVHVCDSVANVNDQSNIQVDMAKFKEFMNDSEMLELFPIMCTTCHKIKNNKIWEGIDTFFATRTPFKISHGICPGCAKNLYPEYFEEIDPDLL